MLFLVYRDSWEYFLIALVFSMAWAVPCSWLRWLSISVALSGAKPPAPISRALVYLVSDKRLFGGDEK